MATKTPEKIWQFDVTDPTLHPNGFTIYKVSCKVFLIASPESLTEVIIWKRYNDFKNLYKSMMTLHKSLHRREEFPRFAKPKLFGRFEEDVIEERRVCAVNLLNFIGVQPYLYRSKIFKEFIKGGKIREGLSGNILKPTKLDILSNDVSVPSLSSGKTKPPLDVSISVEPPPPDNSMESNENEVTSPELDGVWNFPQVPENISLNSYEDDEDDNDEEMDVQVSLGSSLPDTDLSLFDPLHTDPKASSGDKIHTSSSWLFDAMHTCADMEAEDNQPESETELTKSSDGITIDFVAKDTDTSKPPEIEEKQMDIDISEFDPLKAKSDSKVVCGKGDSGFTLKASADDPIKEPVNSTSSPLRKLLRTPLRMRSGTGESVTTMDLGGKEDYIYMAAKQISQAQQYEANGKMELAFSSYKSGVGILLQGVQGDTNKARRDAVRRKTAQYLIKAEDLYNRHLAKESLDEKRWADSDLSPMADMDPALALLKGPTSDLRNYKVLGTLDRVILVMDKATDENYVLKSIPKSSVSSRAKKTILPTSCPFIVGLHKFFETDSNIFLLLQYATGGKLWTYVSAYLNSSRQNYKDDVFGEAEEGGKNVYTGQKIHHVDNLVKLQNGSIAETDRQNFLVQNTNTKPLSRTYSDHLENDNMDGVFAYDRAMGICNEKTSTSIDGSHVKVVKKRSLSTSSDVTDPNVSDYGDVNLESDYGFRDVISKSRNCNMECFSINSFDSTEGLLQRMDSNRSDTAIGIIPEEEGEDVISTDPPKSKNDEVFGENVRKPIRPDQIDPDKIVQDARDLLKIVERTLSQTDAEVEEIIFPQKLKDLDSSSAQGVVSLASASASDILSKDLSTKMELSGDKTNKTCTNNVSELEVSIYDLNRSNEGSCGSDEDQNADVCSTNSESTNLSKAHSDSDASNATITNINSRSSTVLSRTSTLSGTTNLSRKSTPPPKLSRTNSRDMCHSASFEKDLTSPGRSRLRTISAVFKDLDYSLVSPDQPRLPESCIQHWSAEMVLAISRLHEEGIICRDLKPDNILLGERGHILLSYFCQLNVANHELDFEAIDNFYAAPEVRGIAGYTESCDWWSLGALMFELLTSKSLYSCHPGGINSHTQLFIPDFVSSEAKAILTQLLCYNPRERLGAGMNGAEEIKLHPFFSGINWAQLELS